MYEDLLPDHQLSRVKQEALGNPNGRPNDKVKLLPVLKALLQEYGRFFCFNTVNWEVMVHKVYAVGKAEHFRAGKAAAKKPAASRTAEERPKMRPWTNGPRQEFETSYKDLLEIIGKDSTKRHFDMLWFSK